MTGLNLKSFLFVFVLCFVSFLAGWLSAAYIIPAGSAPEEAAADFNLEKEASAPENAKIPFQFFSAMRDNIMILFDPYKIDSALKKSPVLTNRSGGPKGLPLKADLPPSKAAEFFLKEEAAEENRLEESETFQAFKEGAPPSAPEGFKGPLSEADLILQEVQAEYDKKNRLQLEQIKGEQSFFKTEGRYSFFINAFSEQEAALEFVAKMKETYPLWSFLLKAYRDHIRIYLGPFESKEKALEFKNALPQPLLFNLEFLEEVSL